MEMVLLFFVEYLLANTMLLAFCEVHPFPASGHVRLASYPGGRRNSPGSKQKKKKNIRMSL